MQLLGPKATVLSWVCFYVSSSWGAAFQTGFLCVTLNVLGLALYIRLASNSQKSPCLSSDGIKGMHHHIWLSVESHFTQPPPQTGCLCVTLAVREHTL